MQAFNFVVVTKVARMAVYKSADWFLLQRLVVRPSWRLVETVYFFKCFYRFGHTVPLLPSLTVTVLEALGIDSCVGLGQSVLRNLGCRHSQRVDFVETAALVWQEQQVRNMVIEVALRRHKPNLVSRIYCLQVELHATRRRRDVLGYLRNFSRVPRHGRCIYQFAVGVAHPGAENFSVGEAQVCVF